MSICDFYYHYTSNIFGVVNQNIIMGYHQKKEYICASHSGRFLHNCHS